MTAPPGGDSPFRTPPLAGQPGPVMVLADTEAIARRAAAWAAELQAAGRPHRVRLVGPVAVNVDDLVTEAVSLAATAMLAAGGPGTRQAARAVAARLGLPLVIEGHAVDFSSQRVS